MLTLSSVLERTVRLYGGRPAIVDPEGDLTWSAFGERIARAAAVLRSLGVGPGDRFAIISRTSFRYAELVYAGYWSGAVPVPVNYRLAAPEIAAILDDAGCGVVVIEDVFAGLLETAELAPWRARAVDLAVDPVTRPAADLSRPQYEALLAAARPAAVRDAGEDDDALLVYTGGTTGRGKGVPLSHRNIVANALQLAPVMRVRADDICLHSSPMFHSGEIKSTVFTMFGAAHTYLPEFTPAGVFGAIETRRVTVASMVPTMIIRTLQDDGLGATDISSLRLLSYGTSPIAVEWIRRAMERFAGVGLQQFYGLTETAPIVTVLDEDDHRRALESGDLRRLRSAGRPLAGVDLRIVDDGGAEVAAGEAGEIAIRAPNVARGYHNRSEETAAAFRDGWLYTGDIGCIDEDGYLYVLDRRKEMIVTGGENVYSTEVEAALYEHPEVREAAVVGVPDEQFGEALFAVIVPADGATLSPAEIIAHCRGRIGGYKIPRRMAFVDELPKSTMGKVLKADLRRIYGGPAADAGA